MKGSLVKIRFYRGLQIKIWKIQLKIFDFILFFVCSSCTVSKTKTRVRSLQLTQLLRMFFKCRQMQTKLTNFLTLSFPRQHQTRRFHVPFKQTLPTDEKVVQS